jgi:thiamine pyrophosphate-dependent acetolactate synthase large subunit-like protein
VILSAETDLLLGVGTSFGELSTHAWDPRVGAGRRILHIDVDPNEIGKNYSVDAGLVGDARHVLREINFQLERDARWLEQTQDLGPRLAALRALKAITPGLSTKRAANPRPCRFCPSAWWRKCGKPSRRTPSSSST